MAKLKFKLVNIYAPKIEAKRLMKKLQEMSVIDVDTASMDEETNVLPEGFSHADTSDRAETYERNFTIAESALKILNERFPEKKGISSMFTGPREISSDEFYLSRPVIEKSLSLSNDVIALERKISETRAEKVRLNTTAEQMKPWENLDVALSFSGTSKTASFIGSVAGCYTEAELLEKIAETDPSVDLYTEIVFTNKDATYIFSCCPLSQKEKAEALLRELAFARPVQITSKLPKDKILSKQNRSAECDKKIDDSIKQIESISKKRAEIETFADFCSTRAERYRTIGKIAETKNTVLIKGYVAEIDIDFLTKTLNKDFTVVIETEDVNEDLAPVRLKNNAFSSPAETITKMYSLPSSKDIDPTPLTGFFYYLLFGMMLSDAGYGLLIVILTSVILKKFKPKGEMNQTIRMFFFCGISTVIWGLIFGSFFGDSISAISKTFFGNEVKLPALIDPMHGGAVQLLILSIVIGFVQIIAGLVAKFITCMKNGDKKGAFFDAGLWITTLLGLGFLAVGMTIFEPLKMVGIVITLVSLLGLILTQGRENKNPVMRILKGLTSLYDITGYVSDLLSFSRLMALGLTTAAMGAVFNLLGTMGGKGIGGFILMIIILPVGHGISFALNALGAYVHTLRLQYVELFSKFYDGGGREFKSFSIKNKYVAIKSNIKEEN